MDAGRRGEQLVVGGQGGGGVLEEHVPGVEARVPGEERGELREEAGEHPKEAPLGDTAELAETDAGGVERERQRLPVEVAAGEHRLVVGETRGLSRPALSSTRGTRPKVANAAGHGAC